MTFASRESAGRELGEYLRDHKVSADVAIGLPRGGVVVAAEVARSLHIPLDVLVVRKIGHPWHREYAVGALAEGDTVVMDQDSMFRTQVTEDELRQIIAEETDRLNTYLRKFRRDVPVSRTDKRVLVIDDGLATGATMEAAVKSLKQQGAREVIVAVPVASTHAVQRLAEVADKVFALENDPAFDAVGRYYEQFEQTTDEEVVTLLHENEHVTA